MTFGRVHSGIIPGPRTQAPPSPQRGTRLTERIPVRSERWFERAACIGQGTKSTSVWHEPWNHPADVVHNAIRTCITCPVLDECGAEKPGAAGLKASYVWVINGNNVLVKQDPKPCAWCRRMFYGKTPKARCCSSACRSKIGAYEHPRAPREQQPAQLANLGEPLLDPVPLLSQFGRATTADIAERCGVTVRTVVRWRWGGTVRKSTAIKVCRRLRVDPERIWSTWT